MTMNPKLSLEVYERQLDRIHHFFPRLDSKVTALFAVASGQIAVTALNLSSDDLRLWWITVPLVAFLLIIGWSILNLYRCAYPHLEGGHASLVYFNEIAKLRESEYIGKLGEVSESDYQADVAGQIWRNSEIVSCKYAYLKKATISAMIALIPWAMVLSATSLSHARIPLLKA